MVKDEEGSLRVVYRMHDITLKITKKKTRKLVILMEGDNEETVIAPGKTKNGSTEQTSTA